MFRWGKLVTYLSRASASHLMLRPRPLGSSVLPHIFSGSLAASNAKELGDANVVGVKVVVLISVLSIAVAWFFVLYAYGLINSG
jgi:hypothetical protein